MFSVGFFADQVNGRQLARKLDTIIGSESSQEVRLTKIINEVD